MFFLQGLQLRREGGVIAINFEYNTLLFRVRSRLSAMACLWLFLLLASLRQA